MPTRGRASGGGNQPLAEGGFSPAASASAAPASLRSLSRLACTSSPACLPEQRASAAAARSSPASPVWECGGDRLEELKARGSDGAHARRRRLPSASPASAGSCEEGTAGMKEKEATAGSGASAAAAPPPPPPPAAALPALVERVEAFQKVSPLNHGGKFPARRQKKKRKRGTAGASLSQSAFFASA